MSAQSKIIAMIPARRGSTRLKAKNLALLNGRPLVSYAIEAAKASGVFDRVVLNSEDDIFSGIAKECGAEFYKRPADLASSTAKSDTVVNDFILKNPCDIVAWVNSTSPLQTGGEIRSVAEYFRSTQGRSESVEFEAGSQGARNRSIWRKFRSHEPRKSSSIPGFLASELIRLGLFPGSLASCFKSHCRSLAPWLPNFSLLRCTHPNRE